MLYLMDNQPNPQFPVQLHPEGGVNKSPEVFPIEQHPEIPPIEELVRLASDCLLKIQQLTQEVNQNLRLSKHFEKAKASSSQVSQSIAKIGKGLQKMKIAIEQPEANLSIITVIMVFLKSLLATFDPKAEKNIDKAIWILEFESKMSCCMDFIATSLFLPPDITTLPKKDYASTWHRIESEVLGNQKKIQDNFNYLKKVLAITTSAVLNQMECDWAISKLVTFGLSYPKYFVSDKEGQLRSMAFYRQPTIQTASKIWNLPQNGMTKQLAKLNMKNVATNVKIYIPLDPQVLPNKICDDDGKSIQVRLLNHLSIKINKDLNKKTGNQSGIGIACLCGSADNREEDPIQNSTVILHMHGGGFIALSSRSMQSYTRQWARSLKVPIFSVDYRMPSDHPFPSAPEDCLRVYQFLVNHVHKYMNIRPKRIILAGDSAGGNLAFSLMGLILKNKLPPPIGIYTAYPACDLRLQFSPSKIHAFTDPLLHPPMLLLCLHQYLGPDPSTQQNPLASPLLLTEEFIGGEKGDLRFPLKWPKTVIQVGAKDPLYDDSLKIVQRMVGSGIDVNMQVYSNLSHGFLSLDFVIEECKKTIKDSITHLKILMRPQALISM